MPSCVLCENDTFDAVDGLYYCTTCGTQSQDIRDEEANNEPLHKGHTIRKRGGKKGRAKFPRVKGKPWVSFEAYQFILKAQVEALISLGVNSALKDVVGQLWFRFLQKSKVAFTGGQEGSIVDLSFIKIKRDKKVLMQNMKGATRKGNTEDLQDEIELCSELAEEEFFKDDNPYRDTHESSSEKEENDKANKMQESTDSSSDDDDVVGSVILKTNSTRHPDHNLAKRLSLPHTLSFCYMGLLWMKEPIFISDLLRWVKEGSLPYCQVSTILPKHMKFSGVDALMFSSFHLPKYYMVFRGSVQLLKMLSLPIFDEHNLLIYTSRFILDLQLPAVLHGVVNNLMKLVKPEKPFRGRGKTIQAALVPYEEEAMAYIMVTLKICYDFSEKPNEKTCESKDSETYGPTNVLPLLTDWLQCRRLCQSKKMARGIPWTHEELQHVRDPTKYTEFCAEDIYGSRAVPDPILQEHHRQPFGPFGKSWHKENRTKYSELFKSLIPDEGAKTHPQNKENPTSFFTTCRHVATSETKHGVGSNDFKGCFATLGKRAVSLETLRKDFETGQNIDRHRYCIYSKDDVLSDVCSEHLYVTVLRILADHITADIKRLHLRVTMLEEILLEKKGSKRFTGPISL